MTAASNIEIKIQDAFSELMEKQTFSSIRVTAIIENSHISHRSFYRFYQSKYDLAIDFFSRQLASAVIVGGKNATFRDVMMTILTIIKSHPRLYGNLLNDDEGAKILPDILTRLSTGWTGFSPAWATTIINTHLLIDWSNSRFASPVEKIYTQFIYNLPAYELFTKEELTARIQQYESKKASDFIKPADKILHK